jgi:hypothetical protein
VLTARVPPLSGVDAEVLGGGFADVADGRGAAVLVAAEALGGFVAARVEVEVLGALLERAVLVPDASPGSAPGVDGPGSTGEPSRGEAWAADSGSSMSPDAAKPTPMAMPAKSSHTATRARARFTPPVCRGAG